MRRGALISCLAFFCCSCSIWEHREVCPCVLTLCFDGAAQKSVVVMILDGESVVLRDTLWDLNSGFREYEVPRSILRIVSFCGNGSLSPDEERRIVLPEGEQMVPLHLGSALLDTRRETVSDTLDLHKEYVNIQLLLKNMPEHDRPFSLMVCGNSCGVDLENAVPVEGDFEFEPRADPDRYYLVRVPRQMDASLRLTVDFGTGEPEEYPIGKWISDAGYDWSRPELDDILIEFDRLTMKVGISVDGWDTVYGNWEI